MSNDDYYIEGLETFVFFCEDSKGFNCEKVLANAKAQGIIVEYDDGRDRDPWFNAFPGPDAEKLCQVFIAAGYERRQR